MTQAAAKITKNMTFLEMLRTYPETAKALKRYNLACASCMGAQSEPIDLGAVNHGLDPDQLLADLNAAVK